MTEYIFGLAIPLRQLTKQHSMFLNDEYFNMKNADRFVAGMLFSE